MYRLIICGLMAGTAFIGFTGCGSSDSNNGGSSAGMTAASNAATGPVTVSSTQGALGTYLVDGAGKSLYAFDGDSSGTSNCTGQCAQAWPPLIVPTGQTASVAGSADNSLLGTIARADGSTQVTYNGLPLYYDSQDSAAGTTNGQGANSYGGQWWLVGTDGTKLTQSASQAPGGVTVGGICYSDGQCCDLEGNCSTGFYTCTGNGHCCDSLGNCYDGQASCDENGHCCDWSGRCHDNGFRPTHPTHPTNPTHPTRPTQPTNPSHPTGPTDGGGGHHPGHHTGTDTGTGTGTGTNTNTNPAPNPSR